MGDERDERAARRKAIEEAQQQKNQAAASPAAAAVARASIAETTDPNSVQSYAGIEATHASTVASAAFDEAVKRSQQQSLAPQLPKRPTPSANAAPRAQLTSPSASETEADMEAAIAAFLSSNNPVNKILKDLAAKGESAFTDPGFESQHALFMSDWFDDADVSRWAPTAKKWVWRRLSDWIEQEHGQQAVLFDATLSPDDIKQGALSDCYYLSSLATLTLRQDLFWKVFVTTNASSAGIYVFQFNKNGRWVQVVVDDLVPFESVSVFGVDGKPKRITRPAFVSCHEPSEMWAVLAEKAYAKLHHSYQAIENGYVDAALVDLTGGVGERWNWDDDDTIKEQLRDGTLWMRLVKAFQYGYLLGCGSPEGADDSEANASKWGIIQSHAYSILAVAQVDSLQLLQLRNPWGRKEWTGDWADSSPLWAQSGGRRLVAKLGIGDVEQKDDGKFWIAWEDFTVHFNELYICKVFSQQLWPERGDFTSLWTHATQTVQFAVTPLSDAPTTIVLALEQDDVRGDLTRLELWFPSITLTVYDSLGLPVDVDAVPATARLLAHSTCEDRAASVELVLTRKPALGVDALPSPQMQARARKRLQRALDAAGSDAGGAAGAGAAGAAGSVASVGGALAGVLQKASQSGAAMKKEKAAPAAAASATTGTKAKLRGKGSAPPLPSAAEVPVSPASAPALARSETSQFAFLAGALNEQARAVERERLRARNANNALDSKDTAEAAAGGGELADNEPDVAWGRAETVIPSLGALAEAGNLSIASSEADVIRPAVPSNENLDDNKADSDADAEESVGLAKKSKSRRREKLGVGPVMVDTSMLAAPDSPATLARKAAAAAAAAATQAAESALAAASAAPAQAPAPSAPPAAAPIPAPKPPAQRAQSKAQAQPAQSPAPPQSEAVKRLGGLGLIGGGGSSTTSSLRRLAPNKPGSASSVTGAGRPGGMPAGSRGRAAQHNALATVASLSGNGAANPAAAAVVAPPPVFFTPRASVRAAAAHSHSTAHSQSSRAARAQSAGVSAAAAASVMGANAALLMPRRSALFGGGSAWDRSRARQSIIATQTSASASAISEVAAEQDSQSSNDQRSARKAAKGDGPGDSDPEEKDEDDEDDEYYTAGIAPGLLGPGGKPDSPMSISRSSLRLNAFYGSNTDDHSDDGAGNDNGGTESNHSAALPRTLATNANYNGGHLGGNGARNTVKWAEDSPGKVRTAHRAQQQRFNLFSHQQSFLDADNSPMNDNYDRNNAGSGPAADLNSAFDENADLFQQQQPQRGDGPLAAPPVPPSASRPAAASAASAKSAAAAAEEEESDCEPDDTLDCFDPVAAYRPYTVVATVVLHPVRKQQVVFSRFPLNMHIISP